MTQAWDRAVVLRVPGRGDWVLDRPGVVGVLNVTPDSFSDGGRFGGVGDAVAAGLAMAEAGAVGIDVGGESTRPGAERVGEAEQAARVVPVIERLRGELDEAGHERVVISVDTTRAAVAAAALDAGAGVVNDVSAGREDGAMLGLVAERGVPVVLMHMLGEPGTMQESPRYGDVIAEVHGFLLKRAAAAEAAGVARTQVVLDPGIGFGKTLAHNLALLSGLGGLVEAAGDRAVLLGASRKRFIGAAEAALATRDPQQTGAAGIPGASLRSASGLGAAADRLGGTAATTALGVAAGVRLFRVHDVAPNHQAAAVAWAVACSTRDGVEP